MWCLNVNQTPDKSKTGEYGRSEKMNILLGHIMSRLVADGLAKITKER